MHVVHGMHPFSSAAGTRSPQWMAPGALGPVQNLQQLCLGFVCVGCRYEDGGRIRPIMHRGSMVEIIVPYGDPRSPFQHKCAFDVMDYGLGATANSLELGCDCLGHIKYFDGMVNNSKGACCVCACHHPANPARHHAGQAVL